MKFFIDTANLDEIRQGVDMGMVDGVTTNPTIMYQDGVYNIESGAKEIASLVNPLPLSIEVTTNDLDEMFVQAQEFAFWAPNIMVKIPHINQYGTPCYGVISQLEKDGIMVNATAALSLSQVILGAKAGATLISVFTGRVSDEGGDASDVIRNSVEWLERWKFKSKLVVGSIRSVGDILSAALAGAHVITIPPQFLAKMADHKYSRETVGQFVNDARKALEMMEKVKV